MTYHVAAQLKMYTIFQLSQQRKPYITMDLASKYFNGVNWRYIDHSSGLEPMQSFAFDDTFCESVGKIYIR